MKPRNYCCCAIPVMNAGIYAVLTEQFALGIIVGTLAVATTKIVGAASPSFAPWVLAAICYVGAAIQIIGFLGVAREQPITFRRYTTLNIMITVAAFSVAAVWIGLSAGRHNTAKANCLQKYFSSSDTFQAEGDKMCEIFPWVDVGLMGGLWVLLAITQSYYFIVISGYGNGQRADHTKFDSVYSTSNLNKDIPMTNRGDPWDSRASTDTLQNERFGHNRQESAASDVAMLSQPVEPYNSPPQPPYGAGHSEASQYSDPYYAGARRPAGAPVY
ncbi:hypothetical protein FA95DRAFT_202621 [Auriscalpium vulgare]|uniref:Uncharacterized protein n=1 Tax=Auriscalpium vulgare TaxID=40419 RepID=A0ACB8S6N3_9AGAM|nr:hypothetical protein FA95DRAFT_202621 [Auriscalpium vulgare]